MIACGFHSFILKENETVQATGNNTLGQLCAGNNRNVFTYLKLDF